MFSIYSLLQDATAPSSITATSMIILQLKQQWTLFSSQHSPCYAGYGIHVPVLCVPHQQ